MEDPSQNGKGLANGEFHFKTCPIITFLKNWPIFILYIYG
jgi:hypothetical protein